MMATGATRPALAGDRWVDDERVLAATRVRLEVGASVVRFAGNGGVWGSGLHIENSVGLGHALEIGVRFGFRFDDGGRGLRADEIARALDTETFGTGVASQATNPELRLRWRAYRWSWGEAGLEPRVIPPVKQNSDVTGVVGSWIALHLERVARLELGLSIVVSSEAFETHRAWELQLGVPIQLWFNLTRGLFVGAIGTVHHFGGTAETPSGAKTRGGVGIGYRFGPCDVIGTASGPDLFDGSGARIGGALTVSCRM